MTTHQTASNYDCPICRDSGSLGRDPSTGDTLYCSCIRGIEAHVNHLAYVLQTQAEALVSLDARRGTGLYDEGLRQEVAWAFEMTKGEHDLWERRFWQMKEVEVEFEPPYQFFPDYADGELVPAA